MEMDKVQTVAAVQTAEEKAAEFKKKKIEAAKRFKERRAAEKVENVANATATIDWLKQQKLYDKMPDNLKKFLERIAKPTQQGPLNTASIFSKLLGVNPKIGDSFTLVDVIEKTNKGKADIDKLVKKWADNGYVVEFTPNPKKLIESAYTLKAINK